MGEKNKINIEKIPNTSLVRVIEIYIPDDVMEDIYNSERGITLEDFSEKELLIDLEKINWIRTFKDAINRDLTLIELDCGTSFSLLVKFKIFENIWIEHKKGNSNTQKKSFIIPINLN